MKSKGLLFRADTGRGSSQKFIYAVKLLIATRTIFIHDRSSRSVFYLREAALLLSFRFQKSLMLHRDFSSISKLDPARLSRATASFIRSLRSSDVNGSNVNLPSQAIIICKSVRAVTAPTDVAHRDPLRNIRHSRAVRAFRARTCTCACTCSPSPAIDKPE